MDKSELTAAVVDYIIENAGNPYPTLDTLTVEIYDWLDGEDQRNPPEVLGDLWLTEN